MKYKNLFIAIVITLALPLVAFADSDVSILPDDAILSFEMHEPETSFNSDGSYYDGTADNIESENNEQILIEIQTNDLSSIPEDRTIVDVDLTDEYVAFQIFLDLILQDKGEGGIAAFDSDMNVVGFYLTSQTRADFFSSGLPKDTYGLMLEVPAFYAYFIFQNLNDTSSMESLKPLSYNSENVNVFIGLRLNEPVFVENNERYIAGKGLENYLNNRGLEPDEVFKAYEVNAGISYDELIDQYILERDAETIADEGARMIYHNGEKPDYSSVLMYGAIALISIAAVAGLIFIARSIISAKRAKKEGAEEK